MRSSLRMRSSLVRMRSSLVVRASDCQCTSCNGPGVGPSIRRHSGIWGAADETVLNKEWKKKFFLNPPKKYLKKNKIKNTKMSPSFLPRAQFLSEVGGYGSLFNQWSRLRRKKPFLQCRILMSSLPKLLHWSRRSPLPIAKRTGFYLS